MPDIKTQINNIRLQLLDLGIRGNTLLHFAPRAKAVHVVDEKSEMIYNLLVDEGKKMSFLPVPEAYVEDTSESSDKADEEADHIDETSENENLGLPPLEEYLEESKGDTRHSDLFLQTNMDAEKLDVSLIKIENEAQTIIQETGLDALYLALGFVRWYESDSSEKERLAPLILIPIELTRSSARSSFKLNYTGLDLSANETLYTKMKNDFKLILPEWPEEMNLGAYFDQIETCIKDQKRWSVLRDKISLGFFSFGKFQMYKDLDADFWPGDLSPEKHPIINNLFDHGFEDSAGLMLDIEGAPEIKNPEELVLVKDCDSSQTEAIVAIDRGANVVIQGPPGTGKSQTITNIISHSLSKGKKILFVAQKMAALEVVKHRLDECHLGDSVLELHSHKSKPRQVLDSLKQTLYQDKPSIPDRSREMEELKNIKGQLEGYVEGVSTSIKGSESNYIDALGNFMQCRNQWEGLGEPDLDTSTMVNWSADQLKKVELLLKGLNDHLKHMGLPKDHPFIESNLLDLSPIDQEKLSIKFKHGRETLKNLTQSIHELAEEMRFPLPSTLGDSQTLTLAAKRATEAPPLNGIELKQGEWRERYDSIKTALADGAKSSEIESVLKESLLDPFLEMDPLPIRADLVGSMDKWYRFILPSYRRSKATMASVYKSLPKDPKEWMRDVEKLIELQQSEKAWRSSEATLQQLFGVQWQGKDSKWEVLSVLCDWIVQLHRDIDDGILPEDLQPFLSGGEQFSHLKPYLEKAETSFRQWTELRNELNQDLKLRDWALLKIEKDVSVDELSERLKQWDERLDSLYSMTRLNRICQDFMELGEEQITQRILSWSHHVEQFRPFVMMHYWAGIVNTAYNDYQVLKQFDRVAHEGSIRAFMEKDADTFVYAQEKCVSLLYEDLPSRNAPGEMEVVRRELNKKRRYLPVRKLLGQAGRVIQKTKPIFMMSPMSVASFLPPGQLNFDLVIFDEASQLTAPDAIGAITRGSQIVVVGDSQQMPPSSFFGKSIEFDDEEAEQDVTADIESILSLFIAQGCPEKMLQWHYRSKHDSLIATSNKEFYDGRLKVFPNSGQNEHATGLHLHHLPDTIYDRGNTRTNVGEAHAIALAVKEHIEATPFLSLGIVAFSMAQKEAILLEVEKLRREHSEMEPFFRTHAEGEEFFVKNLENVQGDERDVIMISIGYGRTKAGNVPTNFGPINKERGERRLNVLISRAKMAMHVYSNFTSDDLPIKANTPRGVEVLKSFLHYAEKGELNLPQLTGREMDSPFEEEVYKAIKELGYDVECQVGSQGFFIDLAIRHPRSPGKYLLAIECDGASYHSSANARDRDRLRQSVLESVGWKIHRIWSTDWFRNAKAEVIRVQEKIEALLKKEDDGVKEAPTQIPKKRAEVTIERVEVEEDDLASDVYAVADVSEFGLDKYDNFEDVPLADLEKAALEVIKVESPVHIQIITLRLISAVGLSRAGARIKARMNDVMTDLVKTNACVQEDDFYFDPEAKESTLRDRSSLPSSERKLEFIAPDEIRSAMLHIVKMSHSIGMEDLISETAGAFGFGRVTAKMKQSFEDLVQSLVNGGDLMENNGLLQGQAWLT